MRQSFGRFMRAASIGSGLKPLGFCARMWGLCMWKRRSTRRRARWPGRTSRGSRWFLRVRQATGRSLPSTILWNPAAADAQTVRRRPLTNGKHRRTSKGCTLGFFHWGTGRLGSWLDWHPRHGELARWGRRSLGRSSLFRELASSGRGDSPVAEAAPAARSAVVGLDRAGRRSLTRSRRVVDRSRGGARPAMSALATEES
jgi:hypothetical protein